MQTSKSIQEAICCKSEENLRAFRQYVLSKCSGGTLVLADVGWKGTMQQGISALFPEIQTKGFYVGVTEPNDLCGERIGLVFDYQPQSDYKKWFDILRSNSQLYEQLLAAPHGSACSYRFQKNGKVDVLEAWDEAERELYFNIILDTQNKVLRRFKKVCVSQYKEMTDEQLTELSAKTILRSCLLQSDRRFKFQKRLSSGFSQNFMQQSIGLKFETNSNNINLLSLLFKPEKNVRYFAKLGFALDRRNLGFLRRPINRLFYTTVYLKSFFFRGMTQLDR